MNEQFYTKSELAEFLKVSERTIDRMRSEGLPSFKMGVNVRFEKELVLKWLKENKQK